MVAVAACRRLAGRPARRDVRAGAVRVRSRWRDWCAPGGEGGAASLPARTEARSAHETDRRSRVLARDGDPVGCAVGRLSRRIAADGAAPARCRLQDETRHPTGATAAWRVAPVGCRLHATTRAQAAWIDGDDEAVTQSKRWTSGAVSRRTTLARTTMTNHERKRLRARGDCVRRCVEVECARRACHRAPWDNTVGDLLRAVGAAGWRMMQPNETGTDRRRPPDA